MQLLVLLLVMEPDLQDAQHLGELAPARRLASNRSTAASTCARKAATSLAVGPRDQSALRPRVARAGRDVVGVEQIGEAARRTRDSRRDAAPAGTARRTRSCAPDAIWSGWHPASTARPDPRRSAAPRAARSPRARRGRRRARRREDRRRAVGMIGAVSSSSRRRRSTDDEVAGVMPNPGLEKSRRFGDVKLLGRHRWFPHYT